MAKKQTIVRIIRAAARPLALIAPRLAARWLEQLFFTTTRRARPPREVKWIAHADRTWLDFDKTRRMPIYFLGKGTGTGPIDGPTVLLVHGWSGRGSQLGAFIAPLLERGFRVVTFDAPGHGDADGNKSSLPEVTKAIHKVVRQAGPIHTVIAHSMGAAATSIALTQGFGAEKLVYIAPPDSPSDYLINASRYLNFGDRVAELTQRRIEKRFGFSFEKTRGTTLAASMNTPLLVIHDTDDSEVPYENGEQLAANWPAAELITTSGLGHNRILRDKTVVHKVIDYLAEAKENAWSATA